MNRNRIMFAHKPNNTDDDNEALRNFPSWLVRYCS